jgi:hypothetical protein
MLQLQILILTTWMRVSEPVRRRVNERDRGEITSTTALIVLLVAAAIVAGGVIASKIAGNANAVPSP